MDYNLQIDRSMAGFLPIGWSLYAIYIPDINKAIKTVNNKSCS